MSARHFLSLMDLSPAQLQGLIRRAMELKADRSQGVAPERLRGRVLAMVFDKSSTRTRVSFEVAMAHFGGTCVFLSPGDSQLGRGEPVEDTARVLSRMVDVIVVRTSAHSRVETFAAHSRVPVINGLSDAFHPCQLLADIQTITELRGGVRGLKVAWVGDGNNMCHSWINAARQFDFQLRIAAPPGYEPDRALLEPFGSRVACVATPAEAATGADAVVTDTWASMGQEQEKGARERDFRDYRVDEALMSQAAPDAVFLHCLPAYRGMEVTAEVLDGSRSVVWEQAENRLHAQKALLEFLLLGSGPGC